MHFVFVVLIEKLPLEKRKANKTDCNLVLPVLLIGSGAQK